MFLINIFNMCLCIIYNFIWFVNFYCYHIQSTVVNIDIVLSVHKFMILQVIFLKYKCMPHFHLGELLWTRQVFNIYHIFSCIMHLLFVNIYYLLPCIICVFFLLAYTICSLLFFSFYCLI